MTYEFKLPDLGEGITSGEIKKWNVKKGDKVEEDDPIAEVETDKAVVELPAPVSGTVEDIKFKEGDMVPVGSVIAVIREEGEETKAPPPPQEKAPSPVQEKAIEKATAEAKEPEVKPPAEAVGRAPGKVPVLATPATRMLAKQLGVDIESIKGTGLGGRITDEDVKAASAKPAAKPAPAPAPAPTPAPAAPPAGPAGLEERIPLRGIRRTISDNLMRSLQHTAQVTVFDDADVTKLSELREQVNGARKDGVKVSYLAFTVKAVSAALRNHPVLNASIDDEKGEIVLKKYYNIGLAIDTPRGLMVAPVKDADRKSIVQISREIKELVELAESGKIGVEQLRGSTFTIANIGSIGGLFATPIINPPESAILEMQQIRDMPRVCDGNVCVRKVMNLSLTIDHRIIDGAEGQRFLNEVKGYLEDPAALLVNMP
ncbi:dihydrolipoamide acetyltransferase family protein [Methanocella arvoryzae]|uniref:Pyruvate dehydrogenase complex E2,dihydrolipoamide acetyltransferase n=1 Tax=Methanocella arvoryzae (strain DSM 22066 / NBRC 105507 / MRE50) TaxID=351160 RepID=Q0W153_METAR|nr:dihydrolipoamide acetyltransferase family protein [Methanocella arvoryzae]CAJ37890.1 pyruvate dehydrogenase complex E2,dihydrolipoamide acetyltransferase [Methanocella arvoryzae MRE50]